MMKSLVANAQTVLSALFEDVRQAYPQMSSLDRDRLRLFTLIKERGLSSLMIDLPNLDNLLTRGLELGSLVLEGPLCSAVSKRIRVPRLFSGLWLRVFNKEGVLRDFPDESAVAMLRQLCCFFKSIELECSYARKLNAVKEYYDVEEELRSPTLLWADEEFDTFGDTQRISFTDELRDSIGSVSDSDREIRIRTNQVRLLAARLQRFCDSVAGELGYYDPYEFTEPVGRSSTSERFLSHGRGSVSDLGRHADKYALPGWSERLQRVFPNDAFGHYRFDNTLEYQLWKESQTSKLIAVPKTLSKPRLIASEPVAHQWCQQITLRWLIQRMRDTRLGLFLDLSDQNKSQNLVFAASTHRLGSRRAPLLASEKGRLRSLPISLGGDRRCALNVTNLATVDLSSASDRLSCWAVERFLRKNPILLSALQASRTPFLRDGISGREAIFLKKFATQGTGVTFPIQSIFFLCCALASLGCNNLNDARKYVGFVRVYGDDIILPAEGYENLCLLLTYLQLKVNENKSFIHGEFRESCGMDVFRGRNVTPIRPKTLVCRGPKSERAMLDTSNNLHKAGLWRTAAWFDRQVNRNNSFPVVGLGLGAVGRTSFCGSDVSHLKSRWNQSLHRQEVRCRGFVSTHRRKPYNSSSGIFQFFAENPSQLQKWSSGVDPESRLVTRSQWVAVTDFLVGSPNF